MHTILAYWWEINHRSLPIEARVAELAEKKKKRIEEEDRLVQESWRFFQPTAECFLFDNLPPQKEFLQLKMRPSTSFTPFSVFHKFLDEKLVKEIADSVPGGHFDF